METTEVASAHRRSASTPSIKDNPCGFPFIDNNNHSCAKCESSPVAWRCTSCAFPNKDVSNVHAMLIQFLAANRHAGVDDRSVATHREQVVDEGDPTRLHASDLATIGLGLDPRFYF
uniref:RanBP2-type domain-containing protein n=1 Tax=Steinernema glaseri TaxID=37863 RepID=A0A1I8AEQ6_9BILA